MQVRDLIAELQRFDQHADVKFKTAFQTTLNCTRCGRPLKDLDARYEFDRADQKGIEVVIKLAED